MGDATTQLFGGTVINIGFASGYHQLKYRRLVRAESRPLPCTCTIPLGHAAQGCGYTLQGSSLPVLNFNLRVYSALLHQRMKGREHLRVLQAQREEQGHARGSACRFAVGVACTLPPEGSRRD